MLRELDGIVTLGLDTPEIRAYVGEARRLEIPVVFYNTYVAAQEFLAYVGCDYEQSGTVVQFLHNGLYTLFRLCIHHTPVVQNAVNRPDRYPRLW